LLSQGDNVQNKNSVSKWQLNDGQSETRKAYRKIRLNEDEGWYFKKPYQNI
jgi:hypothetical protein